MSTPMPELRHRLTLALCALAASGLGACATAHQVVIPAELAKDSIAMPFVEQPDGSYRFGPYAVTEIVRSGDAIPNLRKQPVIPALSEQRLAFNLREDGTTVRVECVYELHSDEKKPDGSERVSGGKLSARLTAVLTPEKAPPDEVWTLVLAASDLDPLAGTLSGEGQVVDVQATKDLADASVRMPYATAYLFKRTERFLASAELVGQRTVRLRGGLDPGMRRMLAGAAAALELHRDPNRP